MKIRFYLALAAAALVMTNCSQDEELVQVKQSTKGFTATIEGASRSDVTEAGVFSWTAGDKISVWNGTTFDVYANSEGNESTFVAEDEEAGNPTGYAIYPAGEHAISGSDVTINLPVSYAHGSTNAPMLATIEEGSSTLAFKHLGGLMRFVVNNVPVGASSFVFTTTNNILTGSYTVDSEDEIKQNGEGIVNANNNNVTITFTELTAEAESMVFYVPLPVGTYGEYTVAIKGTNVDLSHPSTGVTNTIGRCTMLLMPEFTCTDNGLQKGAGNTIPVNQEEAANLSGIQNVTIDTDNAGTNEELDINYTPLEGNAILNITDDSNATESQDSKAKIKIIPTDTDTQIESLNLNTPTLTAELGAGKYGTVEALTANQTLIIAEGVTIEKLILNGGALEVAEGATNYSISNIIVKDAVGLTSALTAGGKVTLAADITLTEMATISKDLNLDLAGHTLNFEVATPDSWPCLKNTATTSIYTSVEGGKIVSNDVGVQNNGTLTINCDIESSSSAINNVYNGKVTIEGGSYKSTSTTAALIGSNNFGNGTPSLTINAGRFESVFTNVSYNNASTGAVNGGTFICTGTNNSTNHNIYVGGENGNCNVTFNESNCSFTSNGIEVFVGDMSGTGTKTNTVNNTQYTGNQTVLDITKTPEELVAAVAKGGNVILADDITLTEMTTISKDLNLDLAGHTLNFEVATPDSWPCLKNTATTSIYTSVEGGKIVSNDVGVQNNGTLTINCRIESASSAINNINGCITTIEGGSYVSTATEMSLIAIDGKWDTTQTPNVIINGGTFESVFTNLSFNNGAKGTINGGTFTCTGGWHNIYAGGENGGCVVTYDESECNFTSNGQSIYVHNEGEQNSVTPF